MARPRKEVLPATPAEAAGRPPIPFTDEMVNAIIELTGLGMTQEEVAARLGISTDTIQRAKKREPKIQTAFDSGFARLRESTSRALYREGVENGNVAALTWLEKTRLGVKDKSAVEVTGPSSTTLNAPSLIINFVQGK